MKIQAETNLVHDGRIVFVGQVFDVKDEKLAKHLIERGDAIEVAELKKK